MMEGLLKMSLKGCLKCLKMTQKTVCHFVSVNETGILYYKPDTTAHLMGF